LSGTAAGIASASATAFWPRTIFGADSPSQPDPAALDLTDSRQLQSAIDAARTKYGVPGVSAAVYAGGKLAMATSGITNVVTGIDVTADTVMHIGSITKTFTTTLMMQLVDEGKLALERPLVDYLPDFHDADPVATRAITVGELLNHTSGIDANLLADAGHDKETIENTVMRIREAPQLHAPAGARSYCNAGMVVAGYLCQRVTGKSWYDLMKERIFAPLGMEHAVVLPEDAVLYRLSVGHYLNPATKAPIRTPRAYLPISYAPAGSTAMMNAADLMTFARTHMADGVAPNGKRILSAASAARMRERFGTVSGPEAFDCGLGWLRVNGLLHHEGGGPGIVSLLVTHPQSQTAIVILTNADYGATLLRDLVRPFIKKQAGIDTFADPPKPLADATVDPAPYVGVYQNSSVVHEVEAKDGKLTWTAYARASYDQGLRTERLPTKTLLPCGNGKFLGDASLIAFVDLDASGRARYLQGDFWLYRRK
jgi:CubicO group peptidase (beta-lactamase class C family)